MSHVCTIDLHITDLDALEKACKTVGLEFNRNQTQYRWYGYSVGDFPLPEGFQAADLGKCEHAIAIPGNAQAYEIGVVKRRDGKSGYTLVWDFWNGGFGLENVVGKDCGKLKKHYTAEVTVKELRRKGMRVTQSVDAEGQITIRGRN